KQIGRRTLRDTILVSRVNERILPVYRDSDVMTVTILRFGRCVRDDINVAGVGRQPTQMLQFLRTPFSRWGIRELVVMTKIVTNRYPVARLNGYTRDLLLDIVLINVELL